MCVYIFVCLSFCLSVCCLVGIFKYIQIAREQRDMPQKLMYAHLHTHTHLRICMCVHYIHLCLHTNIYRSFSS